MSTTSTELEQLDPGRWLDTTTGLVLVRAPNQSLHRVFETRYSALNPPIPAGAPTGWSRWDVADHVTVYGAGTAQAAFVEALGSLKPAQLNLSSVFPGLRPGADPVGAEWDQLGHMAPGQIAKQWRVTRCMTTIRLRAAAKGWFVDISHAETVSVLRRTTLQWAPSPDLRENPRRVDVSLLSGGNRDATTAVARWVRSRHLADGSKPAGIRFSSKHGTNLICWAVWIPLNGETDQARVRPLVQNKIVDDPRLEISANNPDLQAAARLLGIRVH